MTPLRPTKLQLVRGGRAALRAMPGEPLRTAGPVLVQRSGVRKAELALVARTDDGGGR